MLECIAATPAAGAQEVPRNRHTQDFSGVRRKGGRKSTIQKQAASGQYDADVWEFVLAVNAARSKAGGFLRESQIFEVVLSLGYRKTQC